MVQVWCAGHPEGCPREYDREVEDESRQSVDSLDRVRERIDVCAVRRPAQLELIADIALGRDGPGPLVGAHCLQPIRGHELVASTRQSRVMVVEGVSLVSRCSLIVDRTGIDGR